MSAPTLPDVARSFFKALIVSLASAGLVAQADANNVIALLELHDA